MAKPHKARMREYRERALARGLCTACFKGQVAVPEQICEACRVKSVEKNRRRRTAVIAGYGGRCACCGEARYEFLSLDHVHNDGAEERRRGVSAAMLYTRVMREGFPSRYQLLCHNCNMAKGLYGQCPHVAERTNVAEC